MALNQSFVSDSEFHGQAASEIAAKADEILVRISSLNELRPISLKPIFSIKEKLLNLSSLDRRFFGKAVRLIDMVLGEMPDKDIIVGDKRQLLVSLLILLRQMNFNSIKSRFQNGEFDKIENLLKLGGYEQVATPETPAEAPAKVEASVPEEAEAPAASSEDSVIEENPDAEEGEPSQEEALDPVISEAPDDEEIIDDEELEGFIDDEEFPAGIQEDLDEDYIDPADEAIETFREGIVFF